MNRYIYITGRSLVEKEITGVYILDENDGKFIELNNDNKKNIDPDISINPHTIKTKILFSLSINDSLANLADYVGLYRPIWRTHEYKDSNGLAPINLVSPLEKGINELNRKRAQIRKSGESDERVDSLLTAAKEFLYACKKYPDKRLKVELK